MPTLLLLVESCVEALVPLRLKNAGSLEKARIVHCPALDALVVAHSHQAEGFPNIH